MGGYRKQYHLRFSEPVAIPKDTKWAKRHRKSMDATDEDDDGYANSPSGSRSSSKLEVRWSSLKFDKDASNEALSDEDGTEHKYDDSMESLEFDMNAKRSNKKRRWSRELEVGLKNAVEDAMTDGISEMYDELKSDPNGSLLLTLQTRMRAARTSNATYAQMIQQDVKSPSTENPLKGNWLE